jgi:hypothetical protein
MTSARGDSPIALATLPPTLSRPRAGCNRWPGEFERRPGRVADDFPRRDRVLRFTGQEPRGPRNRVGCHGRVGCRARAAGQHRCAGPERAERRRLFRQHVLRESLTEFRISEKRLDGVDRAGQRILKRHPARVLALDRIAAAALAFDLRLRLRGPVRIGFGVDAVDIVIDAVDRDGEFRHGVISV